VHDVRQGQPVLAAIFRPLAGYDSRGVVVAQLGSAHLRDLAQSLARQKQYLQQRAELDSLGVSSVPELPDLVVAQDPVARHGVMWLGNARNRAYADATTFDCPAEELVQGSVNAQRL
jgi:hypothetical protein